MKHPRLSMCAAAMALLASCGDRGVIIDDWGPPAGYTVLVGTVRQPSGAPAVGVEVIFGKCESPIGGFLTTAMSDAAGRFRATGALPPVGLFSADQVAELRVRCEVDLNRRGAPRDSVIVGFATTLEAAPVTSIDLIYP